MDSTNVSGALILMYFRDLLGFPGRMQLSDREKWRFGFITDYSLGVCWRRLCGFTFGSRGDELSFSDNMIVAMRGGTWPGRVAAGWRGSFNLANRCGGSNSGLG